MLWSLSGSGLTGRVHDETHWDFDRAAGAARVAASAGDISVRSNLASCSLPRPVEQAAAERAL